MIESRFTILLLHSLNILIWNLTMPWVLLISNVLIIFYISSFSISKNDNFVSVIYV